MIYFSLKETKEYVDTVSAKRREGAQNILCVLFTFFSTHSIRIYLSKSCKTHFNPGSFSKKYAQISPHKIIKSIVSFKKISVADLSNHCFPSMDYFFSSFTEPFSLVDLVPWTWEFPNWMSLVVDLSS